MDKSGRICKEGSGPKRTVLPKMMNPDNNIKFDHEETVYDVEGIHQVRGLSNDMHLVATDHSLF
jgi:hypothetical protein